MSDMPTARIIEVTPELAREWLRLNTRNRGLKKAVVSRIAGAIKRGEWRLNGETIKRAASGRIQDGQHRLAAVVEADMPIMSFVVEGLEDQAQETIDVGSRRSIGDVLTLRGESNAKNLGAAINALHRIINGHMGSWAGSAYPTHQQGLALLERHPGIRGSVPVGSRINSHFRAPGGVMSALHYVFSSIHLEDGETFFSRLESGADMKDLDAILALRTVLEKRMASTPERRRVRSEHIAAITVKAWNAWRDGAEVKKLYWSPGGARPEPFPVIDGWDEFIEVAS